jgi:hypothetical protein
MLPEGVVMAVFMCYARFKGEEMIPAREADEIGHGAVKA